jgi:hypothetical protein
MLLEQRIIPSVLGSVNRSRNFAVQKVVVSQFDDSPVTGVIHAFAAMTPAMIILEKPN